MCLLMVEKLKQHRTQRPREREDGLALLDVLIGMAIFALIAVIAVSAISQYRSRANVTAVVSDVKRIALQLEADFGTRDWPEPTEQDVLAAYQMFVDKYGLVEEIPVEAVTDEMLNDYLGIWARARADGLERAGLDVNLSPGNTLTMAHKDTWMSHRPDDALFLVCVQHRDGAVASWITCPARSSWPHIQPGLRYVGKSGTCYGPGS